MPFSTSRKFSVHGGLFSQFHRLAYVMLRDLHTMTRPFKCFAADFYFAKESFSAVHNGQKRWIRNSYPNYFKMHIARYGTTKICCSCEQNCAKLQPLQQASAETAVNRHLMAVLSDLNDWSKHDRCGWLLLACSCRTSTVNWRRIASSRRRLLLATFCSRPRRFCIQHIMSSSPT